MDTLFLIKGLVVGFSIAAPVGPIGVLCIRRTLAEGWRSGFASGLGAATADSTYGLVAGLGLTIVSAALVDHQTALRLAGGLFLCYLGGKTFVAPVAQGQVTVARANLAGAYASTFLLTLTNPLTILAFAAIFAGLGLDAASRSGSAALLVLGVFLGSALWWLLLSTGANLFRDRLSPGGLGWINKLSGIIITAFGVAALASVVGR